MMESLALLDRSVLMLALRGSILLAFAVALAWGLKRSSAGTRHALWTAAFVGLLALPLALATGVEWRLPILPNTGSPSVAPTPYHAIVTTLEGGLHADVHIDGTVATSAVSPGFPGDVATAETVPDVAPIAAAQGSAIGILGIVWLLGALGGLGALGLAHVRLRRHIGRAVRILDPKWVDHADAVRDYLGIRRPVTLLMSDECETPMTAGFRHPVILLPLSADTWSDERRQVVLAHEMVHVQRADALRQVLGRVALSLYWFHPLAWVGTRLARASREEACDERVVALGARPSDYASHLLDLAHGLGPNEPALGLPMIQRSMLEKRIMSILDPNRGRPSRIAATFVALLVGGVGLSAAMAQPVPAPVQEPSVVVAPEAPMPTVAPTTAAEPAPVIAPEPTAEPWPILSAQEATCRMEGGVRGSFSGTISTRTGRSEQSGFHNGNRVIQKYIDDMRLCLRIQGDVVMHDDGLSVRAAGADSWLVIESEEDVLHRLVVTEGSGGIENDYTVDGRSQPFDADAQAWRDQLMTVLNGYWEASRLRGQESSLKGRISSARGHVSSLNGQISSHRGRVSSMRGQMSAASGRAGALNGQISSIRGRLSSMQGQVSSRNSRISTLRARLQQAETEPERDRLEEQLQAMRAEVAELEEAIEAYDVDAKVAEVQRELEAFDEEERLQELEAEIAAYDLDDKVRELEQEIEDYDVDARVRALEREIEELDAQSRAEAIERELESEVAALRRMIRGR